MSASSHDSGSELPDVVLAPGRDRSVRRRHPWLLASAVARADAAIPAGAWVRVLSCEGEALGFGHYAPSSRLRVRLLSFGKEAPSSDLVEQRIAAAVALRADDPGLSGTDAVRLVNAEGDFLPGLVADRYADVVSVRLTSAGMVAQRDAIAAALERASGASCGWERADSAAARREGFAARSGLLWGPEPPERVAIREGARRYGVDVRSGQKTGFYLDQRDARERVQQLASGRRVLDLFCYTGGFSVAAARGGASHLTLVDSSEAALALARENLEGNDFCGEVRLERADAFRFLRASEGPWDLIVIDPPPLARSRRDVDRAARAYKDLLLYGLRRAAPGAYLLAFACSHHVGPGLLRKIAFAAALDAERPAQVLASLGAPVDHPASIDHLEGSYLSGLLLRA
jgi:23S rRNA (cytosine1962-C5)-methyltransferase